MKLISVIGAVTLLAGSIFALYMALHLYVDHQRVDVFHLLVGTLTAVLAVLLFRRARVGRS